MLCPNINLKDYRLNISIIRLSVIIIEYEYNQAFYVNYKRTVNYSHNFTDKVSSIYSTYYYDSANTVSNTVRNIFVWNNVCHMVIITQNY